MGGLCSHMIGLAIVDVPEQQRHPTFALAALGAAVWPEGRFGLEFTEKARYLRPSKTIWVNLCNANWADLERNAQKGEKLLSSWGGTR